MRKVINSLNSRLLYGLFLVLGSFSTALAIDPPQLSYPGNGADSLSPENTTLSCKSSSGGIYTKYEVSASQDFNQILYEDTLTYFRNLPLTNLNLNTTYYWRAKHYNQDYTDSSNWTQVFRFTTIYNYTLVPTKVLSYNNLQYSVSPYRNHKVVRLQFLLDTVPSLTSAYAQLFTDEETKLLLLDSTNFYFKYRTIYLNDTAEWSEIKTTRTELRHDVYFNPYCYQDYISVRFRTYSGIQFNDYLTRYQIYLNAEKTEVFLDTIVPDRSEVAFDIPSCETYFVETTCYNDDISLKKFAKYETCGTQDYGITPFWEPDKFRVTYEFCSDSFQLNFDTTTLFNSALNFSITGLAEERSKVVDVLFPKDPINFKFRYRVKNGEKWADWQYKGEVVIAQHNFPYGNQAMELKRNMYLQITAGRQMSSQYSYTKEYHIDTAETFDSPKHRVWSIPYEEDIDFNSPNRTLFGENNYIKYRIVSTEGKSDFSNVLIKPTTDFPIVPVSFDAYYPYNAPYVSNNPYMPEGYREYEYSLDPNFSDGQRIFSVDNEGPVGLENNALYYVRARFLSARDTSAWSSLTQYTTTNQSHVLHPYLILPPDSSNLEPYNPVQFRWDKREGDLAEKYYMFIYEGSVSENSLVYLNRVDDREEEGVNYLKPNRKYYWTVGARGTFNRNHEPKDYWSFTTSGASAISTTTGPEITAYPNPTSGAVQLRNSDTSPINQVTVYSSLGTVIFSSDTLQNPFIDLSGNLPGTYFAKVSTSDNQSYIIAIQLTSE